MNAVLTYERSERDARIVLESLLTRQSHWPLVEPAPNDDELSLIIDAALRAPDHGRLRPWRFVVVRGAARDALGQVLVDVARAREPDEPPQTHEHRRQRAQAAPMIIALGAAVSAESHIPEIEQLLSVGAATMNMLNAIHALGYGGFWATGPDAYDANLRSALGFQASERLLGFLFVGTPGSAPKRMKRPERGVHLREWNGVAP
ncbi:nitroreductase family protein [Caballeronia novacaledonica]|uniref:Putative NAD(P)H nitroreductase n=1 Tax=Caballeronia novacaledonica TaxID=1544861 RepID=A0A2U3ICU0_9BURK|nr:nitroreductase [Caballeronia novacaledonica]SPB18007.1 nitroreductase family protein [Caballeronia novacaledonica]